MVQEGDGFQLSRKGAEFTISKGGKNIQGVDIHGDTTERFTSGDHGVFYVGPMDYGVYVLHEENRPSGYGGGPYFYLVVDEHGAEVSDPAKGYSSDEAAKAAGDARFKERQEAAGNN